MIAEKETVGVCLDGLLREQGYHVTIAESYDTSSDVSQAMARTRAMCNLVIATNTSLPPARIRMIVPDIRARYPQARIMVLSGYCPDDFVADLREKGIDQFLALPFKEDALIKEVAELLSKPRPSLQEVPFS